MVSHSADMVSRQIPAGFQLLPVPESNNETYARFRAFATVGFSFVAWYYASGLCAVSSQQFVASLNEASYYSPRNLALSMLLATFFQMVCGVMIGFVLDMSILSCSKRRQTSKSLWIRTYQQFLPMTFSTRGITAKFLIENFGFPVFYAAGSLLTNFGYACSSASLVQMIKLMEPMQSIVLGVALRKLYKLPSPIIKWSITLYLLGIILIFLNYNPTSNTIYYDTFGAVIAVLLSGFFLSSKNAMKEIVQCKERQNSKCNDTTNIHTETGSATSKLLVGVEEFIHLSLGAALVLLPILIVLILLLVMTNTHTYTEDMTGNSTGENLMILMQFLIPAPYITMIVTHSIYNVASIALLSFVAPSLHSALIYGNRLFSITFAMAWFGDVVTLSMLSGFFLTYAGAVPFPKEKQRMLFVAFSLGTSYICYSSTQLSELYRKSTAVVNLKYSDNHISSWMGGRMQEVARTDCKVQFIANDMRICHVSSGFGLELGPAVILKILEKKFQCSIDEIPIHNISYQGRDPNVRCLFSVGSTFHRLQHGDFVWGTGMNPSQQGLDKTNLLNVSFFSVRGPKTAAVVKEEISSSLRVIPYGEPAFLIASLYSSLWNSQARAAPGEVNPQHLANKLRICFVYHPADSSYISGLPLTAENVIATNTPWREVLDFINLCDYVASSSLYGIVVADAMGKPSLWFQFPDNSTSATDTFKYQDYYHSIGRRTIEDPITDTSYILDLNKYNSIIPERARGAIVRKLLTSFPFQLFTTTTSQVPSNRTLVIMMGTVRGGEVAWSSMYRQLLEPNSADLALLVPKDAPRASSLFHRAKYVWEHDEYLDWGIAIEKYIVGSNETQWRQMVVPRNCLSNNTMKSISSGLFGGVKEHTKCKCLEVQLKSVPAKNHSCYKERHGSGAIIFLLRVLVQEKIKQLGLIEKYDRFVLTRSDHYYGCIHNLHDLDNNFMWIPNGEDYYGITDRYLICNSSHILKALNILPPVVLNPQKYWQIAGHINPEGLIKRRWVEEGLWESVRRFPRNMFTCASWNDTSRWLIADFSRMVSEGVYLKYVDEYRRTKDTCNGTRNYFTGEFCKVCNNIL